MRKFGDRRAMFLGIAERPPYLLFYETEVSLEPASRCAIHAAQPQPAGCKRGLDQLAVFEMQKA